MTGPSPAWLESLMTEKRAGRLKNLPSFWVAAERLNLVRAVYPDSAIEPKLSVPDFEAKRNWEHSEAVRELVRGRMEVSGPMTQRALTELFQLPASEIEAALLSLEGEGFILRGKFHPAVQELQW